MSTLALWITAHAFVAAAFTWVAIARLRHAARPGVFADDAERAEKRRILLLRPLDAPTPQEVENFAAPLDVPGLEHVVVSPFRPRLPDGVQWLYSDPPQLNRKAGHVLYATQVLEAADAHVLVIDADVRVEPDLVRAMVAQLAQGAQLVTAAPSFGGDGRGAFALGSLLGHTHHDFAALHAMSAGAKTVCGKALGLGPQALDALRSLSDCAGEDLELSKALHAHGQDAVLVSARAFVPKAEATWASALNRMTRWMRVLRGHRPALFPTIPLLFAPTPLLLLAALLIQQPVSTVAVLALVASRAALSLRLGMLRGEVQAASWRWLVGEALLLSAFARALTSRIVEWRGRRYRVGRDGRMQALADRKGEEVRFA